MIAVEIGKAEWCAARRAKWPVGDGRTAIPFRFAAPHNSCPAHLDERGGHTARRPLTHAAMTQISFIAGHFSGVAHAAALAAASSDRGHSYSVAALPLAAHISPT